MGKGMARRALPLPHADFRREGEEEDGIRKEGDAFLAKLEHAERRDAAPRPRPPPLRLVASRPEPPPPPLRLAAARPPPPRRLPAIRIVPGYVPVGPPFGRGTFAEVLRARARREEEGGGGYYEVAIKRFLLHRPDAKSTFDNEVAALEAASQAEGVVRMLGHSVSALCIVMEAGRTTLRHHLRRGKGRGGVPDAEALVWRMVQAVRGLHSLRIAHRDLKPENVLLMPDGSLKLCDLGLARSSAHGRMHTLCGTPAYMAPEMWRRRGENAGRGRRGAGRGVGAGRGGGGGGAGDASYDGLAVDVWAVGTVAYEVLHRVPAFEGPTLRELGRRIRAGAHRPVRMDVPPPLRALLRRCWSPKPCDRAALPPAPQCPRTLPTG